MPRRPGRRQGVRRYQRYGQTALDLGRTLDVKFTLLNIEKPDQEDAVVRLDYDQILALLDDPEHAVDPGPGKFEGTADLRVARALHALSLDGECDDQLGTVDSGMWIGLIGRFVAWEDPQGFFSYEVFDTSEESTHSFLGYGGPDDPD